MRRIYLYLPPEKDQDVICERWKHLFKMIDRMTCEVRVYEAGLDFAKADAKYDLPYAVDCPPNSDKFKRQSFESMWKKFIVNTGKAEDDYIPKYD